MSVRSWARFVLLSLLTPARRGTTSRRMGWLRPSLRAAGADRSSNALQNAADGGSK